MKYRAESRLALFASFLLLVAALLSVPVGAAVNEPDCAALEQWALSIDKKDRWEPLAGNRSWLPRVFQAEDFATLFGAAALDWTVEDTRVIGVHLNDCMKMASRARRYDAQKALAGARNYITGSLKGILVQAESRAARAAADSSTVSRPAESRSRPTRPRAEDRLASRQQAALDEALSELLALPDTTELLRALGMLRAVDFNDPESYGKTYGRIGLRAGRKLLQALRNLETDTRDPRVAPQLDARYQVLHAAMIDKNVAEIEGLDASLESLQALSRKLPSLQEELGSALTPEDRELLGAAIVNKRLAIQQTILGRAKQLIDRSPETTEGIQRIDSIVANTEKAIVSMREVNEVRAYARARQQAIGDAVLESGAVELATFPATLEGLGRIRDYANSLGRAVGPYASKPAAERYNNAAVARITGVARGALSEFKQELAALPDSRDGLHEAEKRLEMAQAMHNIEPDMRAAYVDVASQRRAAISEVIERSMAEQRKSAIAAGGDPDIVGYTFVDTSNTSMLEFRDERRVIFAVLGMKFAGDYEVSRDDVIIEGPNGTLVFTKHGKQLAGMGLTFQRQQQ